MGPEIVQTAVPPAQLAQYLSSRGWERPASMNVKHFLGMLSPDTPMERLPVFPHLHSGWVDRLRLVHRDEGKRWVLRLGPSDFEIAGEGIPLFVGTIETQRRQELAWLITAARDTGDYEGPLETLSHMLDDRFTTKAVARKRNEIQVDREHGRLRWPGEVLLISDKTDRR